MSDETRAIVNDNLMSMMKTFSHDHSKTQREARKQLIMMASGNSPYSAPAKKLSDEQLEEFLTEIGIRSNNQKRFMDTGFDNEKRASTTVDNEDIVTELKQLLEDNSELAHRSRDEKTVPGEDEKVRARIMMKSFRVVFQTFNDSREAQGLKPVGETQLYEIVKTKLTMFRAPSEKDRAYAQCSSCAKFQSAFNSLKRNTHLKSWEVEEKDLLALSVCSQENASCMNGVCSECQPVNCVAKIKAAIPSYQEIMDETISFNVLVQYNKSGNKGGQKSTIWLPKHSSIDRFISHLVETMHCNKSKGTGVKVS